MEPWLDLPNASTNIPRVAIQKTGSLGMRGGISLCWASKKIGEKGLERKPYDAVSSYATPFKRGTRDEGKTSFWDAAT